MMQPLLLLEHSLKDAKVLKETGNAFFKTKMFVSAREKYLESISRTTEIRQSIVATFSKPKEEMKEELKKGIDKFKTKVLELELQNFSNLAGVELKLFCFSKSVFYSTNYLLLYDKLKKVGVKIATEKERKITYRRFKALLELNKFSLALKDIKACCQLTKESDTAYRLFQNEKNLCTRMFYEKGLTNTYFGVKNDEYFETNIKGKLLKGQTVEKKLFGGRKVVTDKDLYDFYKLYVGKTLKFKREASFKNNFETMKKNEKVFKQFRITLAWEYNRRGEDCVYKDRDVLGGLSKFEKAFIIFNDLKSIQGIVTVFNNLGNCFAIMKFVEKSLTFFRAALEFSLKINDKKNRVSILKNILLLEVESLRKERSKTLESGCRARIQEVKELIGVLDAGSAKTIDECGLLEKEGMFNENIKNFKEAIKLFEMASTKYKKLLLVEKERKKLIVNHLKFCLNHLSSNYRQIGEHKRATAYYKESVKLKKEDDEEQKELKTLKNASISFFELGKFEKCLSCLKKGLKFSLTVQKSLQFHKSYFYQNSVSMNQYETLKLFTILARLNYKIERYDLAYTFCVSMMERVFKLYALLYSEEEDRKHLKFLSIGVSYERFEKHFFDGFDISMRIVEKSKKWRVFKELFDWNKLKGMIEKSKSSLKKKLFEKEKPLMKEKLPVKEKPIVKEKPLQKRKIDSTRKNE